jgi:kynurenine formamidase
MKIRTALCVMILVWAGMARGQEHTAKLLDMTYAYDNSTVYWPTAKPFRLVKAFWGMTDRGYWYASNEYSASEHGGTHADAPIHFARGGRTIDQVPLQEWIGPAAKIDVAAACAKDRNYLLRVADIRAWEQRHGKIPAGAWVLMYTGLDTRYYPDPAKVLGTALRGAQAVPLLSFPGFSPEAAEFLVRERQVVGIGLDTPSIDHGPSQDFRVHRIICGAGKLALENLAALDRLPEAGAVLYALPMLIREGTGAPARVFAVLP